jgi:pimeloyl-ACP methyl ester carboxylesterase
MIAPELRRLRLWRDRIDTEIEISGNGPALVYMHGPWGIAPDRPFIERLAARHTVYAPNFPGTTPGNPEAVHGLETWLDLILYYSELFDALGLAAPVVVGHSFGALVGAELAAASPKQVGRLVLIDPLGLWRDDLPVKNWMLVSDQARRPLLFADPAGEAANAFFDAPAQSEKRVELLAAFIWAQACAGKFIWPIPERGFENRSHRIIAPSLVIWGKSDRIIAPDYAQDLARQIASSRIEYIDDAGHLAHLERGKATADLTFEFLSS